MAIFIINNLFTNCTFFVAIFVACQCCDSLCSEGGNNNSHEGWFKRFRSKIYDFLSDETEVPDVATMFPDSDRCDIVPLDNVNGIPVLEDLAARYGYYLENYRVVTKDGYILTLFRMKASMQQNDYERTPVLLQHGIMDSAATFMLLPTNLAYYMVDRGYDVWVSNSRGARRSKKHTDPNMDPFKRFTSYWDFSFNEIGEFDLPAVIDVIREVRKNNVRIHYLGYSMGTTAFFVMASEKEKYQQYIGSVVLLGPVARIHKAPNVAWKKRTLAKLMAIGLRVITVKDVYYNPTALSCTIYKFCQTENPEDKVCKDIVKHIPNPKWKDFKGNTVVTNRLGMSQSTSLRGFIHYLQIAGSGRFRKYDFGCFGNKRKYKQWTPPDYDLGKIYLKIHLFIGDKDEYISKKDIEWLQARLRSSDILEIKGYDHDNYLHSGVSNFVVYDEILKKFKEDEDARKIYDPEEEAMGKEWRSSGK